MPLYTRKCTVVDAEQFLDGDKPPRGVKFSDSLGTYVTTKQGRHVCVSLGEWIVKEHEMEDRFYPIADDEFQRIYELAR